MSDGLNKDFSERVVVRTEEMPWQASPSPKVWRKRLDLTGDAEASRVTSVVRYDPQSRFHSHPHPDGEEIFVYCPGSFPTNTGITPPAAIS